MPKSFKSKKFRNNYSTLIVLSACNFNNISFFTAKKDWHFFKITFFLTIFHFINLFAKIDKKIPPINLIKEGKQSDAMCSNSGDEEVHSR